MTTPKRRTRRPAQDASFTVHGYLRFCGAVVRCYREQAGLLAKDVAVAVGMTAAPIHHFETATGTLHLNKFLHVCAVVGIPLPFPFTPHPPADIADIVDLLCRATPDMQAAIRAALIATDRYPSGSGNGTCP